VPASPAFISYRLRELALKVRVFEAGTGVGGHLVLEPLQLDLLGDGEGVIHLDPEIANGALQFRVAEQQLNRPQVAGLLVNLCRLRSAQRMRPVRRTVEPGARYTVSTAVAMLS
jgi:hypothetical protein